MSNKYRILSGSDFKEIQKNTYNESRDKKYAISYIRQLLRGYVKKTVSSQQIFDEADKIVAKQINEIQS